MSQFDSPRVPIQTTTARLVFNENSGSIKIIPAGVNTTTSIPSFGQTAIYEITCSAASMSGEWPSGSFMQTGSRNNNTGSYLAVTSPNGVVLNMAFISSSVSSSSQFSIPYESNFRFFTMSLSSSQDAAGIASKIYYSLFPFYSASVSRRSTKIRSGSVFVSQSLGLGTYYSTGSLRTNFASAHLPNFSMSLHTTTNDKVVKIFLNRTGSSRIFHTPELTSSYGFVINTVRAGSGLYSVQGGGITGSIADSAHLTASMELSTTSEKADDFFIKSLVTGKQLYVSGSGRIGINTTNPKSEFEVVGTITASQLLAPEIKQGGNDVVSYTVARTDNIAIFGDTGIVTTGDNTLKANISGDITAVRNISASGQIESLSNISASGTVFGLTGSFGRIEPSNITFGEVVNLVGTDPRLRLKAVGANHPGIEWYEDSTRKWVVYNDPDESDSLVFKNDSTELIKISQTGDLSIPGKLIHEGDTDTFINLTDDDINIQAGGVNFIDITQDSTNEITFNEAGADIDFRVEGDADINLLVTNAGTDRVGIGTNSPSSKLQVDGDLTATHVTASGNISGSGKIISENFYFPGGEPALRLVSSSRKVFFAYDSSLVEVAMGREGDFTKFSIGGPVSLSNITSSGAISASGNINASSITASGDISASSFIARANYKFASDIVRIGEDTIGDNLSITGGGLKVQTSITASNGITASGQIHGQAGHLEYRTGSIAGTAVGDIIKFGNMPTLAGAIYAHSASKWVLAHSGSSGFASSSLALAVGTNSTAHGMLLRGMANIGYDPGGDNGCALYLERPGSASNNASVTSGHVVRVIGWNYGSDTIYFNPDNTWILRS